MGRNGVVHDENTRNREKQNAQSQIPRFFKIIFGEDCEEVLYLPPQFAPKVKHLVNQQIQIEDSCGQQWPVKLRQDADGSLVFKRGWPKFFLDHDLEEGEFLVFDYMNEGHFIVHIYGKNACERIKFNNGRSSQNKRLKRDPETDFPCEAVQKTSITLKDKPSPDYAVASGTESQNPQMQLSVENGNCKGLQIPPGSIGVEDINCMINRECEHTGQEMNILYDLSIFEMGNMKKDADKFEEALDAGVAHSRTGIAKHSNSKHYGTHMSKIHTNLVHGHSGDVFTVNFNKDLDTRLVSSKTESMEQCKITGHEYQISKDNSNVIIGSSSEISGTKFKKDSKASPCAEIIEKTKTKTEKDSVSKASPYAKVAGKTKTKFDATEMDVVPIEPVNGDSGGNVSGSFCPKTSYYKNLSRGTQDKVFTFPHETGKNGIKKELEALKQGTTGGPMSSCGNKPNTGGKYGQVLCPVVKIEPDLSSDIGPLISFSPFMAEVKHLSCLVLPEEIPSVPRRRERGRLKVVYLTDPLGRMWPVLYADTYPIVSLTCNWRNFCERNNIKIGDNCTFRPENNILGSVRVDIAHRSC